MFKQYPEHIFFMQYLVKVVKPMCTPTQNPGDMMLLVNYKVKDYKERPHEYKEEYVTVVYRSDRNGVESLITLNYPHNY